MDHRYMRPPPPPPAPPAAADPYQRPPPPPIPPPPSNHPWSYSTPRQFHYQPQSQHSPSPPPPPQWAAPPRSSDHTQYPPPPPPPYPAHHPPPYPAHAHYPPPRPPHVPQSYSQDWGSGSWSHHQNWEYPTNNNEEDWAAKARAWAAAKAATDNQHPQSQFVSGGRPEGQSHFHNQYSQPADPQFHDVNRPLGPVSSYQQYPVGAGPPNGSGLVQSQEFHYISSGQPSYTADVHVPYPTRDGSLAGDSTAPFHRHENSSMSPLVHQQEVPSSYSSIAGNEVGDRYEGFSTSSSMPPTSIMQHHGSRSGWMEEPIQLLGSQPAEPGDLSDQPLNFAPHFNRDTGPHAQSNYMNPSAGAMSSGDPSSNYAWAPSSASGVVYPPVTQKIPPGPQVDHPIAMPSPASGHSTSLFPSGPGFQPNVSMLGSTYGVGSGVMPHHTAFSGDAYGVSGISERPKKASVPNWLREEIIKNKAVITSSTQELGKEDSQSIEEDTSDKFSTKIDQADSKSIDSSRSTEDENEDEEEVEAARTAAINQEIKRILTEVLLKVTDELFDEIADKVLKENDISDEVGNDIDLSNHQVLPSTQASLTPKASAKILIPAKAPEVDVDNASEKSTSGSPGDVLGLASYASDEEDEGIQTSAKLKDNSTHLISSSSKVLGDGPISLNGGSSEVIEQQSSITAELQVDGAGSRSPVIAVASGVVTAELNDVRELGSSNNQWSSRRPSYIAEDELQHGSDDSKANKSKAEKENKRNEKPGVTLDAIRLNDDVRSSNSDSRSDKNAGHEYKKSSIVKDHTDSDSVKERLGKKADEENSRPQDRHAERSDYHNGSKDKVKEKDRTGEKTKDSQSRKRLSPADGMEGTSQTGREKRNRGKEDTNERRRDETREEKKERSRHKTGSDSSRHKRHRSPSPGGRGRESKNNAVVSYSNDYSDQSSDETKRKPHQSKRRKSPSPARPRKRHVSRSPHSRHSKRRHSPYSSLENTRGKRSVSRSRSRSPVHKRRK